MLSKRVHYPVLVKHIFSPAEIVFYFLGYSKEKDVAIGDEATIGEDDVKDKDIEKSLHRFDVNKLQLELNSMIFLKHGLEKSSRYNCAQCS